MRKVFNFSAGPAVLPEEVLEKARAEMLDYRASGMSVMEMSHRGKEFESIIAEAESLLRELMGIPQNYKVLFLQGGASLQFAMVPINLMTGVKKAHYFNTGMWAKKAIGEGKKFGTVNIVATSEPLNHTRIPEYDPNLLKEEADYVYIVTNNTIYGTKFSKLPETGNIPLVADMSSNILSEPIDVSKFGLIFAGAQKNIGPAGVTIVIIREDLIGKAPANTPTLLDYKIHAENGSMYNTPPCYSIYVAKLVFEWLKAKGGVAGMAKINREKAGLLYDYLDSSKLFKSPVRKEDRSLMNVPFVTGQEEIDKAFVKKAEAEGLKYLHGHRSVGGMRASIYNAMPVDGIKTLIRFMEKFEKENK